MISQDACAYYDDQVLIPFGGKTTTRGWGRSEGQGLTTRNHLFAAGAVFDNAEGTRIASFVGPDKKVAILQNHGIVSLGRLSIDEAAWWCDVFLSERTDNRSDVDVVPIYSSTGRSTLRCAAKRNSWPTPPSARASPSRRQAWTRFCRPRRRWARPRWAGSVWPRTSRRRKSGAREGTSCKSAISRECSCRSLPYRCMSSTLSVPSVETISRREFTSLVTKSHDELRGALWPLRLTARAAHLSPSSTPPPPPLLLPFLTQISILRQRYLPSLPLSQSLPVDPNLNIPLRLSPASPRFIQRCPSSRPTPLRMSTRQASLPSR